MNGGGVLFAASEVWPLSKTGGLGDVAYALPEALARSGSDIRLVTPAYRGALARLREPRRLGELRIHDQPWTVWEGRVDDGVLRLWLLQCDPLFDRDGGPYLDRSGQEYADNAWRFGCFCMAVAALAQGALEGRRAALVHLNDWQTGLVPVWLSGEQGPRTLFSIHNLAYQGVFDRHAFAALGVPDALWHPQGIEFHGRGSFLKAGLALSDRLATVSPSYAEEIQTPEHGHGLEGLLRHRGSALSGILNGIQDEIWNPQRDPHLPLCYGAADVASGKAANKAALRRECGLADSGQPLFGVISRLAGQKGIDLLLDAIEGGPQPPPAQWVVLGAGEAGLETRLRDWAARHAQQVSVTIGYDEGLAHRIEAGADAFFMPSRYEPCGLNQMYSQRYGTVPVVRGVGGLRDSVVDATPAALADGSATGIVFRDADVGGVRYAIDRALALYGSADWRRLQDNGMARDFSWRQTAQAYRRLYDELAAR